MQVLSIDDDIAIREAIQEILELDGYSVATACNGKEALDLLQDRAEKHQSMPQLILLDMTMPIMDGWKFSELVAQNSNLNQIPIVVISSVASADQLAGRPQIKKIIKKPISIESLLNTVNELCGSPRSSLLNNAPSVSQ